jgi:leucyl aminopeptidase
LTLKHKLSDINVVLPNVESIPQEDIVRGVVEGLLLPNYGFTALKKDSIKDEKPKFLEKICLVGASKKDLDAAETIKEICKAVYLTRDLVNGNADDVTPQHLARVGMELAKKDKHLKTTVFDKKRIEKEKMGLLLAVNRGSHLDPVFMTIEYKGNPKSTDHTVLVGKGITFDTGGLNLKPTGSMETMKTDMSGAAIILGVMSVIAKLKLKVNVTGVIASTENAIDAKSYKPGDVYCSRAGKTVENGNTDAEGRLVLADALSYAVDHLKPTRIIDFATLTGAIDIALGNEAAGLFTNNDVLADFLIRAGSETGERLWRLPLYEEYREQLRSDIADIKSTGGRSAGSITAAMFLQEFVGKVPWAHLDIAATAYSAEARRYNPKFGTGIGVRLIVSLLQHL